MHKRDNNIRFIVGCPRSGTYLLSSILNAGNQIAIPTETHFVPLFLPHLWLAGDLSREANRKRLIRAIFIFLRVWLARAEEERDFKAVTRHSLLEIEKQADDIAIRSSGYGEIVLALFAAYAELKGAPIAGDKSAFFNHIPLDQIDAGANGSAKYVHVIRDGRDVCVSWLKLKVGPRSIAEAAIAWSEHISGKRAWGALHPDRYHEMRYEDLLANPIATLRKVCEFIGVPFSNALLEFHTAPYAKDIANSSTHVRLSQPLDGGNHGKWRNVMSPEEIVCFENIARKELQSSGYELSGQSSGTRSLCISSVASTDARSTRIALKNALPAFALLASRTRFPLDRICNSNAWLRIESRLASRAQNPPHS